MQMHANLAQRGSRKHADRHGSKLWIESAITFFLGVDNRHVGLGRVDVRRLGDGDGEHAVVARGIDLGQVCVWRELENAGM